MDPVAVYVPRCIQNRSESLGLEELKDFAFGIGGCSALLNAIGPDVFEYCFV
jgi:hypothetical protein